MTCPRSKTWRKRSASIRRRGSLNRRHAKTSCRSRMTQRAPVRATLARRHTESVCCHDVWRLELEAGDEDFGFEARAEHRVPPAEEEERRRACETMQREHAADDDPVIAP